MPFANHVVEAVLRSPLHPLMSGSTDLVRYRGRTSGREFTTPTQYARLGDDIVVLVARPATKTWWRNFREPHDLDVLVQGDWRSMTGRVVLASEEPARFAALRDAYLDRFPKAARSIGSEDGPGAVVVWCRPRAASN